MSRIGKKPIEIPSGVNASLIEGKIEVKGSLGSRSFEYSEELHVEIDKNNISVKPKNLEKKTNFECHHHMRFKDIRCNING